MEKHSATDIEEDDQESSSGDDSNPVFGKAQKRAASVGSPGKSGGMGVRVQVQVRVGMHAPRDERLKNLEGLGLNVEERYVTDANEHGKMLFFFFQGGVGQVELLASRQRPNARDSSPGKNSPLPKSFVFLGT